MIFILIFKIALSFESTEKQRMFDISTCFMVCEVWGSHNSEYEDVMSSEMWCCVVGR
jgi:hypothetical protein